jgi:hypothetical protein
VFFFLVSPPPKTKNSKRPTAPVTPEACLRHDGGRFGAHPRSVAARAAASCDGLS